MTNKQLAWNVGVKIIIFIVTMFILSITIFYVSRSAPGDPLQSFYGEQVERMSPSEQSAAKIRLGLDQPIFVQYERWIQNAVRGDFGISFKYKEPAAEVVQSLIINTIMLGGSAFIIVFVLAVLLAICCTMYEDRWIDRIICKIGTIAYYLPPFWMGLLFILIFNVNLGWLPGSGAYDPGHSQDIGNRLEHMVLPLVVMITGHVWYYAYMIRNKLLDEVRQEYVLLARAKGLGRLYIVCTHCLRNVAPTIVSIMAISVNHVLGGTYVVEAVFSYPGIGNLSIESAKYHDYNLLMIIVLITGAWVIAAGLIAQVINEYIDPRMKIAEEGSPWKN